LKAKFGDKSAEFCGEFKTFFLSVVPLGSKRFYEIIVIDVTNLGVTRNYWLSLWEVKD